MCSPCALSVYFNSDLTVRWTGHVIRMPGERLPKKVFYGELQEGKRSQGGRKKRYKDTLKASLKDFDIPIRSWEQAAQKRSKRRGLINKGAAVYEKKRICEAERKCRERKANTNGPPAESMTPTCSTCNRQFRARIGLVSHQKLTNTHEPIQEVMMVFLISERRTTRAIKCTRCLSTNRNKEVYKIPYIDITGNYSCIITLN